MVEKLGVSMQSGTPKFIVSSVEHFSILFSLELLINNVLVVAKPTQKSQITFFVLAQKFPSLSKDGRKVSQKLLPTLLIPLFERCGAKKNVPDKSAIEREYYFHNAESSSIDPYQNNQKISEIKFLLAVLMFPFKLNTWKVEAGRYL